MKLWARIYVQIYEGGLRNLQPESTKSSEATQSSLIRAALNVVTFTALVSPKTSLTAQLRCFAKIFAKDRAVPHDFRKSLTLLVAASHSIMISGSCMFFQAALCAQGRPEFLQRGIARSVLKRFRNFAVGSVRTSSRRLQTRRPSATTWHTAIPPSNT